MRTGEILRQNAKVYGKYVIRNRAFSEFCDGLKPAQRALLWSAYYLDMHKIDKEFKSAKIIGIATGNYHPHGDNIYGVLCNMMPSNVKVSCFETDTAMGDRMSRAGSSRYTGARLSKYGKSFLYEDYLPWIPKVLTYDGSGQLPIYLPALYPNLLLNGSSGIGYGASAYIPPFTIESIRPLIKKSILGKSYNVNELEFNFMYDPIVELKTPEFFETGKGTVHLKPRRQINREKTKYLLSHTFILSRNNKAKIFSKLDEDPCVARVHDMSKDYSTLNIEIILKGELRDREKTIEKIDKIFSSQQRLITVWLEGPPGNDFYEDDDLFEMNFRRGGLKNLIDGWADYRLDIEDARLKGLLDKTNKGLNYQELLLHAALNSDKVFNVLDRKNKYKNRAELDEKMADALDITKDEAHEVTGLANYRLSSLERIVLEQKIMELREEISDLRGKRKNLEEHTSSLVDTGLKGLLTER